MFAIKMEALRYQNVIIFPVMNVNTDGANPKLLAFHVETFGIECITFAKNRSAAKYNVFKALEEANYRLDGSWPAMIVSRAPECDKSKLKENSFRKCYAPEFVKD